MMSRTFLGGTAAGLITLALATPALALSQPPASAPARAVAAAAPSQSQSQYSEDTLQTFVSAYQDIAVVRETYTGRLQQTQDPAKAQALQQEARQKMMTAIQDNGMDLQTYNKIAQDLGQNEQLRKRVVQMVQQQQPR